MNPRKIRKKLPTTNNSIFLSSNHPLFLLERNQVYSSVISSNFSCVLSTGEKGGKIVLWVYPILPQFLQFLENWVKLQRIIFKHASFSPKITKIYFGKWSQLIFIDFIGRIAWSIMTRHLLIEGSKNKASNEPSTYII